MPEAPTPKTPPGEPVSQIQTAKPFIGFTPQNVPPAQQVYLQQNDAIVIHTVANAAFPTAVARYRYLTPQGEIKEGALPLNIAVAQQFFTLPLNEVWLLSIVIDPGPTGAAATWIYAEISVDRGIFTPGGLSPQGIIWQGYIGYSDINGWPGGSSKGLWDGPGNLRVIVGTVPGAGADINEQVPSGRRWQLIALQANLNTSATVANRLITFSINDGAANQPGIFGAITPQAASTFTRYTWAASGTSYADALGSQVVPMPITFPLKAGYHITSFTQNLQAGDQWSALKYQILEWANFDA